MVNYVVVHCLVPPAIKVRKAAVKATWPLLIELGLQRLEAKPEVKQEETKTTK